MARIYGKIGSLKSLKSELESNGISRFSSVKEVNDFLANYQGEKNAIIKDESDKLEREYQITCANLKLRKELKANMIHLVTEKIDSRISDIHVKVESIRSKNTILLNSIGSSIKLYLLKRQLKYYLKNKSDLISASVQSIKKNIEKDELFIQKYESEKHILIESRTRLKIERLEYIRNILESTRNLISGAIGENLVAKEVAKLSDNYVLINDFNLRFSRPIFYKKQKQKIYSIQIDHLLVSKAGIFIIETKNWSKSSVDSLSLRSPIDQIQRSSFALYVFISENITLDGHHWGEQKVPIRNLIVMIKNKPRGQFKYVRIKLLNELNDYIRYFEPVLTDTQLHRIITVLK